MTFFNNPDKKRWGFKRYNVQWPQNVCGNYITLQTNDTTAFPYFLAIYAITFNQLVPVSFSPLGSFFTTRKCPKVLSILSVYILFHILKPNNLEKLSYLCFKYATLFAYLFLIYNFKWDLKHFLGPLFTWVHIKWLEIVWKI